MWENSVNSLVFCSSLIQNLKCLSWSQSTWNEDWGGRYFPYPPLTWSATTPARNRNEKRAPRTTASKAPLAPAQVWFQKATECSGTYSRRLWRRRRPCLGRSSAGRRGATWGRVATICLDLTCTFLWETLPGLPPIETHRVSKFCCAFHVFVLFSVSKVDCPEQNNTAFREQGEFSFSPCSDQSLVRKSISAGGRANDQYMRTYYRHVVHCRLSAHCWLLLNGILESLPVSFLNQSWSWCDDVRMICMHFFPRAGIKKKVFCWGTWGQISTSTQLKSHRSCFEPATKPAGTNLRREWVAD